LVLVEDQRRADFKTSLAGHRVRQLRHRGWFRFAREAAWPGGPLFALRCV